MKYKISVIVPIYNSEATLLRCLESIQNQTLDSIQIILVDDGSTDGSLKKAKEFSLTSERAVTVLSEENSGPSAARNLGLDYAEGEYVSFVDSDDEIKPNMYELMYKSAQTYGSDVVSCGREYRDARTGKYIREVSPKYDCLAGPISVCPEIVRRVGPLMCDKLFRRSIIEDSHIRFDVSIRHAEDFLFSSEFKLNVDVASGVGLPLYVYYINNDSSLSGSNAFMTDIPKACSMVVDLYKRSNLLDCSREELQFVFLGYYVRKLKKFDCFSSDYRQFKRDFILIFNNQFRETWRRGFVRRIKKDKSLGHFKRLALLIVGLA